MNKKDALKICEKMLSKGSVSFSTNEHFILILPASSFQEELNKLVLVQNVLAKLIENCKNRDNQKYYGAETIDEHIKI